MKNRSIMDGMESYMLEKSLNSINTHRVEQKLKPIKPMMRKCLRCDKKFKSLGPQHRLCGCGSTVYGF